MIFSLCKRSLSYHTRRVWQYPQLCLLSTTSPELKSARRTHKLSVPSRNHWIVHDDLRTHVRESRAEYAIHGDLYERDTGLSVCFLGTGAGRTSLERGNSATALRMGSSTFLFDAGEGVQTQMMRSKLKFRDVRKIFITHLHGDHIFGLLGLLLSMQESGRSSQEDSKRYSTEKYALQIYGPVGLYNFIAMGLSLSMTEIKRISVEVYELEGGSRRWLHPGGIRNYAEFRHRGVKRISVPPNKDGTWTLCEAEEIKTPEDAIRFSSRPKGIRIKAAELHHIPKLQCFGYVVEEPQTQPINVDVEKAMELGLQPGKKYKLLKGGFPVMSDDGLREIRPEDVSVGEPGKPRKFALLGDCCNVPRPMAELCRNADVLIHEATFLESDSGERVDFGGHSTSAMAGRFADYVDAKVLLLNHISPAYSGDWNSMRMLVQEAEKAIQKSNTRVQASYDLLELLVPRDGFDFDNDTKKKAVAKTDSTINS